MRDRETHIRATGRRLVRATGRRRSPPYKLLLSLRRRLLLVILLPLLRPQLLLRRPTSLVTLGRVTAVRLLLLLAVAGIPVAAQFLRFLVARPLTPSSSSKVMSRRLFKARMTFCCHFHQSLTLCTSDRIANHQRYHFGSKKK